MITEINNLLITMAIACNITIIALIIINIKTKSFGKKDLETSMIIILFFAFFIYTLTVTQHTTLLLTTITHIPIFLILISNYNKTKINKKLYLILTINILLNIFLYSNNLILNK